MSFYPNYNQFYGQVPMQPIQAQMPKIQPMEQSYPQYTQQPVYKQIGLQGKSVDSIDVVKAMDIPLDGSISYFPIADGTAIVTKQLQQDGSSKTIVYKPVDEKEVGKLPKYVTVEELNESIKKIDNGNLKDEIKNMKRQIKDIFEDIKEINDDIRKKRVD